MGRKSDKDNRYGKENGGKNDCLDIIQEIDEYPGNQNMVDFSQNSKSSIKESDKRLGYGTESPDKEGIQDKVGYNRVKESKDESKSSVEYLKTNSSAKTDSNSDGEVGN